MIRVRFDEKVYEEEDIIEWMLLQVIRSRIFSGVRSYWQFWWLWYYLWDRYAFLEYARAWFLPASITFGILTYLWIREGL